MDFLQLVAQRCSVRAFKSERPSDEVIHQLIEAARLSPSACNRQPWHFYLIESDEAKTTIQQAYPREWFATAPLYIAITVHHDEEWVRQTDGHRHGIVDASIAAEHICLAAAALGLGSCWVCAFDVELCSKALPLAADEEPVIILPIGFPAPDFEPREKTRKPQDEILSII